MVASALIAAGGSILGGLFGKSDPKDVVPNYKKRRRKAEEAGFNPLTALGVQASVGQSANYMGSAIADAALLLADGLEKDKEKTENEALKAKNKALQEKVTSLTLRPKVPGVYGQRSAGGVNAETSGHSGVDAALGRVALPDATLDRGTPAFVLGELIEAPPGWTSPSVMEDEVIGDNELLSWPYGLAWSQAALGHNARRAADHFGFRFGAIGPQMKIDGQRYAIDGRFFERKASKKLDDLAKREKPRSRTTDWEKRHKSRWIFD